MNLIDVYQPLFYNPPLKRYTLLTGGRASSKSFHVAVAVLNLTYEPNHVILYTRYTLTSAFDSIIPEFIEKIELIGKESDFDITKTDITNNKTGSKILFRGIKTSSGKQTAKLKSIFGVTTWILEEGEDLDDETDFEKIDDSIRTKAHPNRVIIIMNPSFKTHYFYRTFISEKRDDVLHIHTDYRINKHNLSESILQKIERIKLTNPHRYEHVYLGKWLDNREGLLWNQAIIDRCRINSYPKMVRIVVAIDPAITSNKYSDETGIIVFGRDAKNNGYVLEDSSGIYTPDGWAIESKRLKEKWDADCYVAEKNQGGDMVETILRQVDDSTRIKLVHATKGKYTRAEPIFSLYEQNRIFHIGTFTKLETQMVTFNPDIVKESPDRVDAMVWGATNVMIDNNTFSDWSSITKKVDRVF
jgi:PBSX family phage terminase large subunit